MPFFQVTAISNVGSIFNIAFGLVDNEREDGFRWLVEQLYGFQTQLGISDPDVIVTDSDAALKSALKTIFSGSRQQQCIFHINKNVVLNVKRKWRKPGGPEINTDNEEVLEPLSRLPDDEEVDSDVVRDLSTPDNESGKNPSAPAQIEHSMAGLFKLWKNMVFTIDETEFDENWTKMQQEFADQPAIIGYLQKTWIPCKEEWAMAWTSRNRNFGQRTTSPTEAAHRDIKSYLIRGTSDLYRLSEVVTQMLEAKEKTFNETIARQKLKQRHQFMGSGFDWLGTVNREVA